MSFIERVAPRWALRLVRRGLHGLHAGPPLRQRLVDKQPSLVPLDSAYPGVVRRVTVAPVEVLTPEVLDMPLKEDATYLQEARYVTPRDYVTVLRDALYCPVNHVVLTPDRDVVDESSNAGNIRYLNQRVLYNRRSVRVSEPCTPWRGPFHNYYHLLVDMLPRLLAIEALEAPIHLLCPRDLTATELFFLDRLGAAHLPVRFVEPDRMVKADRLILTPFKAKRQAGYLPSYYRDELRRRLLPRRPSRRRRLLISRERARRRRLLNRQVLLDALVQLGFEEVMPETLSPAEQIELFHDAEVVIATHGAGLTNVLFGTDLKVVELFPTPYVAPHYYFLCKSLGHRYAYCCGREEDLNVRGYRTDVLAVLSKLAELGICVP